MIVVRAHFSSKADQLMKVILEPILGTTGPHSRQRYSSYLNSSLAFTPAAPQKPVLPVCSLALCHAAWMHPVRVGVSLRPCPCTGVSLAILHIWLVNVVYRLSGDRGWRLVGVRQVCRKWSVIEISTPARNNRKYCSVLCLMSF